MKPLYTSHTLAEMVHNNYKQSKLVGGNKQ